MFIGLRHPTSGAAYVVEAHNNRVLRADGPYPVRDDYACDPFTATR